MKKNVRIRNVYEIIPRVSDNMRENILGNKNKRVLTPPPGREISHTDAMNVRN